jgi:RND family efflux transporter MFP subunit
VASLDSRDFELAVQEASVQLRLAAQDLQRKESLLAEQGISASVVDDARAQRDLWSVRLAQAQERLDDTRILAPFDAYVAHRYVDNRTRIRAGDRIARLLDLNELKVVASVPSALLATVTPERVVSIAAAFDFLPDRTFPLEYRESSGEANPVAQTYEVTFTMARPEGPVNILPGMTAQVRIELQAPGSGQTLAVPTTALQSDPGGGFYVWVYDPATMEVTRRPVTVAAPLAEGVAVASGLGDGELIVAAGASQLQEGMRVRPLDALGGEQ